MNNAYLRIKLSKQYEDQILQFCEGYKTAFDGYPTVNEVVSALQETTNIELMPLFEQQGQDYIDSVVISKLSHVLAETLIVEGAASRVVRTMTRTTSPEAVETIQRQIRTAPSYGTGSGLPIRTVSDTGGRAVEQARVAGEVGTVTRTTPTAAPAPATPAPAAPAPSRPYGSPPISTTTGENAAEAARRTGEIGTVRRASDSRRRSSSPSTPSPSAPTSPAPSRAPSHYDSPHWQPAPDVSAPSRPYGSPPITTSTGENALDAARRSRQVGTVVRTGAKEAEEAALKAGGKAVGKEAAEFAAKAGVKSLVKKIPIVGAIVSVPFAAMRAMEGDWVGAAGELASGVVGTVPGVGTAGSLAIDAALLARDLSRMDTETQAIPTDPNAKPKPATTTATETGTKTGTEGGVMSLPPELQVDPVTGLKIGTKTGTIVKPATETKPQLERSPTKPKTRNKTDEEEQEKKRKTKSGSVQITPQMAEPLPHGSFDSPSNELYRAKRATGFPVYDPNRGLYYNATTVVSESGEMENIFMNENKLTPSESAERKASKQKYRVVYMQDGRKVEVFASSLRGVKRVVHGKSQYRIYDTKGSDVTGYFKREVASDSNKKKD